ncbi:MAG: amidohydrolase [Candidatus Heimdallarchaeota archaeon]|nr:amidohydrolase [Candidatus Heimdallarchaeota archaeon]
MDPKILKNALINDGKAIESYIVEIRRNIHSYPETAFEEYKTAEYIEFKLQEIGYQTVRIAKTGVIAILEGLSDGLTVALRADIDALNVTEETNLPYSSQISGKMHACGHDAHVAMLLGAAKLIYEYKKELRGTLKFIFQPAEEGGGGAKRIVEEGWLDDVDIVFGFHIWSNLPAGIIGTRKGATFASSDRFSILIKGKGGYVSIFDQTQDPTLLIPEIYNALQKIISREINPFTNCVLSVPYIKGSDAHNIIPSTAKLRGTLRTHDENVRIYIKQRIEEIVENYCRAWHCTGETVFDPNAYPSVVNNEEVVEKVIDSLKELDEVKVMEQTMIAEDFSFYLTKARGVFLTLGTYNEEKGIIFPHHHSKFQVDEAILWKGAVAYAILGFYSILSP